MAAELLREGATNTVALLPALPSVSQVPQERCGYSWEVTSTAAPHADIKSFNRATVLHEIWAVI